MVNMPKLSYARRKTEEQQMKFVGMDYRPQTSDGSLEGCDGLSTKAYPSIVPRGTLEQVGQYDQITCMQGFGDDLLVCAGTAIYWNGEEVGSLTLEDDTGEIDVSTARQAAMVNTQVCIWPDRLIFDTDTGEVAQIDHVLELEGFKVYRLYIESEMQYFHVLDFSENGDAAEEILEQIRVNDTIFLTGFDGVGDGWDANNKESGITVRYVDADNWLLGFYDSSFSVLDDGADDTAHWVPLRFEYQCPELELIAEADNRLWGVEGNTIYACALGDPRNWYRYDGLADDSYALSVAGGGVWTAICGYSTHVCFFKEDRIHRIYGNKPSNYSMSTLVAPGVQRGAANSVQVINGVLWYIGADSVYAYDGDTPDCVSEQLGIRPIRPIFAASEREGYYAYMDVGRGMALYCLDTNNAVWTVWDKSWYAAGTTCEGRLYLAQPDGTVWKATDDTAETEWSATFNECTEGVASRKSYTKITVQCDLAREAWMGAEARFDGGNWVKLRAAEGRYGTRVMYFPMPPNRCYSMQLRLYGRGYAAIRGVARTYSLLSDVR